MLQHDTFILHCICLRVYTYLVHYWSSVRSSIKYKTEHSVLGMTSAMTGAVAVENELIKCEILVPKPNSESNSSSPYNVDWQTAASLVQIPDIIIYFPSLYSYLIFFRPFSFALACPRFSEFSIIKLFQCVGMCIWLVVWYSQGRSPSRNRGSSSYFAW